VPSRVRRDFREERVILGELLRRTRFDRHLSQEGLASHLGKKHSFMSRIESGDQILDVVALVDLLQAMKVDPCDFMREFAERCKAPKSDLTRGHFRL